jgi:hypothetical protein
MSNGNASSGDPTPASSAIALLPGMSVVSLPSLGCFDFSPYPGVWAPGCWFPWHLGDGAAAFAPARRLIVALLKRKAENPVAALERELSDLTARRAALEVKLTDAAGALAVAVDERRRRRSSNRSNGKSAVVTINDRGPFVRGRVIDLTPAAVLA